MITNGVLRDGRLVPDPSGLTVVETSPPSSLETGTKAVAHYEQVENQIVKIWQLMPWSEQDWENYRREGVVESGEQESKEETERSPETDT